MSTSKLDKVYNPVNIEEKWYQYWLENNYFKSKPDPNKEPYTIVIPPPNVTGMLTMGHVLNNTIQDILIRKARMEGREACWIPGTDHASIATEAKVVQMLQDKGIKKESLSRDEFLKYSWEWKEKYGGIIIQQLKRLGCSCDWDRERFTMDDDYTNSVLEAFVVLYNKGLIYKGFRLVNWCPVSKSAISDEEVIHQEVNGHLWHFRYPIKNSDEVLIVATTRPETMLGDTAVAVHPKDKRFKHLIGKTVLLPLANREIPIIGDNFVDMEFGSGCVKVTPAHDPNDFDIGKKHDLEFINIMNEDASLNSNVPESYRNLSRDSAREKIVNDLKANDQLEKIEKYNHKVGFSERGNVPIEYYMSSQWFLKMNELSKPAIEAVNNGSIKFHPEHWVKTYNHWMNNINDWCISRQLWWGHRIPVWYHKEDKEKVHVSAGGPNDIENWTQDEDVLDTWFSSALWTFSTLEWPKKTYELERFYPGNVLVTGFDIIFFWVARMMMMGSYFMKETPFKDVYIHPLIRDEKGQKMSKSKGNIIDPLELLDKYGADTLRFTLTSLINPGRDVKLSESRVKGYKSFINKIWNASNFLQLNKCSLDKDFDYKRIKAPVNKWIINELIKTKSNIEKNTLKYLFHEVSNELYHFVWHSYCDWFIEFSKSLILKDTDESNETKNVLMFVFKEILIISHPIIPFITESLWNLLFNKDDYIMNEISNKLETQKDFLSDQDNFKNLILIISSIRNIRSELNIPYKDKIDVNINNEDNDFCSFLKKSENEINKLLKLNKLFINENSVKSEGSANIVISKSTIIIPLKGIIDTKSEINKLSKKKDNEHSELIKIQNKLNNDNFIEKAPKNVIEKFKIQEEEIKNSIEKIDQIINTIK